MRLVCLVGKKLVEQPVGHPVNATAAILNVEGEEAGNESQLGIEFRDRYFPGLVVGRIQFEFVSRTITAYDVCTVMPFTARAAEQIGFPFLQANTVEGNYNRLHRAGGVVAVAGKLECPAFCARIRGGVDAIP